MAWFALHCPAIIQAGEEPREGVRMVLLRRFGGSSWLRTYVAAVRKLLCRYDAIVTSSASPTFAMRVMAKDSRM